MISSQRFQTGNFPAVSFLKAIRLQDAHPGNSDPLDEQAFVVKVANFLQAQPEWANTALIVLYDDSDGWYDHQLGQIVNEFEECSRCSHRFGKLRKWGHSAAWC